MVEHKLSCSLAEFAGLSQELLKLGSAMRFTAHGTSMHPIVRNGDVLIIKPVEARHIRIGDILLCRTDPENVLVHRVIRKKKSESGFSFLVKGDQGLQADGWISQDNIFGFLVAVERDGERIEFDNKSMKALSFFAVMRSRWHAKDVKFVSKIIALVKKVPFFSQYLE